MSVQKENIMNNNSMFAVPPLLKPQRSPQDLLSIYIKRYGTPCKRTQKMMDVCKSEGQNEGKQSGKWAY